MNYSYLFAKWPMCFVPHDVDVLKLPVFLAVLNSFSYLSTHCTLLVESYDNYYKKFGQTLHYATNVVYMSTQRKSIACEKRF